MLIGFLMKKTHYAADLINNVVTPEIRVIRFGSCEQAPETQGRWCSCLYFLTMMWSLQIIVLECFYCSVRVTVLVSKKDDKSISRMAVKDQVWVNMSDILTISRDELPHSRWNSTTSLDKLDLGHNDVIFQNRAAVHAHSTSPCLIHINIWASAGPAHPWAHDGGQRSAQPGG